MGAAAGLLSGGAAPSVSASSSASSGPQSGETGNLVLSFGGINLGNQDIPLSASSSQSSNAAPTIGTVPSVLNSVNQYLPLLLVVGAVIALYMWHKSK